ncbi:MAG TPA: hypothetical protein VM617_04840, partial [Thermoanaerobaculia bacterium]|nr:hypothetical protein [Thermoanaerobaculia bacterium]
MTDGAGQLERVRGDLRRLGYLSDRFDRFLLQDATRPRRPLRATVALALRVALLAGTALAALAAVVLAAVNGNLEHSPFDVAVLFLHLLPPAAAITGAGFVALAGLMVVVLSVYPVRHIETLSLAVAIAAGATLTVLTFLRLRAMLPGAGVPQALLAVVVAAVVIGAVVKVTHAGLLALAIRLTQAPPLFQAVPRRWAVVVVAAAALLFAVPALLAARPQEVAAPAAIPTGPGEAVLLVGIDGVLPAEIDYLLARGELPTLGRLLRSGGRLAAYRRPAGPPASLWTTVATGLPSATHGVAAVDSYRPLGVATPLARSGPLGGLWRAEVRVGLAEHRPLLAARRQAFTVWELAARGGAPVVAVDWWATYPAEALPGLVVAHGGYTLLAEEAAGAVAPEAKRPELAALARRLAAGPMAGSVAALPPEIAGPLADRAFLPDRFYREVTARALAGSSPPRAAAVYLPGLDIAADLWRGPGLGFADLVREELARTDAFLARALAAQRPGTVAVVFDPGRRAGAADVGRVVLWRRDGCAAEEPGQASEAIDPAGIASGLLAALGLAASAELPPPPSLCPWPRPPA